MEQTLFKPTTKKKLFFNKIKKKWTRVERKKIVPNVDCP